MWGDIQDIFLFGCPKTIDITGFFKKFCIATRTKIKVVDSLESTAFSFASTHFSTHLPIFFVSRAPNPCTPPDSLPLVHPSFQHPDDI